MVINLNNLQPVKVSRDVNSYNEMIIGIPKIGKTTFVHDMYGKRVLFIATEDRHKTVTGAYVQRVHNWYEMLQVVAQLNTPAMKKQYDKIAIDTVLKAYQMLERHIKQEFGIVKDFGEVAYGKAWTALNEQWNDFVDVFGNMGYSVSWIFHAQQIKTKIPVANISSNKVDGAYELTQNEDGEKFYEFDKYVPDAKDKIYNPINKVVDNILFANMTVDNNGNEVRVLHLWESMQWQAGTTFGEDVPAVIELKAETYRQVIKDALNKIEKRHGSDNMVDEKFVPQQQELEPFEETMKRAKLLYKEYNDLGKKDEEFNPMVQQTFGVGAKISGVNKNQHEALLVLLMKLENRLKEIKPVEKVEGEQNNESTK